MTTTATVVPIDYSIKARSLAHIEIALAALGHDPVQIPKAVNHLNRAHELIAQLPASGGGILEGISPLALIAGAIGIYLLVKK